MNRLVFCLLLTVSCFTASAQATDSLLTRTLTAGAMRADFDYLRRILTETHPGLYRYTSRENMQQKMDSVAATLDKPMLFYDFYSIMSKFIADVRCAHTYIVPVKNIEPYFLNNINTIPLIPLAVGDKFYAVVNGTGDMTIRPGFEILEINSRPILEIRDMMHRHIWADGYNKTLKAKSMSEAYFPLFYYLIVERAETFNVKLRDLNGAELMITLKAQRFGETRKFFNKNPVNKQIMAMSNERGKLESKKPWRLKLLDDGATAAIRIKSFGGGNSEEEARARMHTFMEQSMKVLHKNNIKNLIIDLRYNSGGWDIQGIELFTYLMEKPARCYRRLHSVTDSTEFMKLSDLSPQDLADLKKELRKESDGTFSVREEYSEQLKIQNPKPNRFTGKVYVLANGGSASAASEFVAYAKSEGRITLVGEEAGGVYEGGNGGSFLHFNLPNSKMAVGTPLLYYDNNVNDVAKKGFGTMPDYYVPYKIESLLKGEDNQLEFVRELVGKGR